MHSYLTRRQAYIVFSPEYGPWEGGTNITITGMNLGKSFEDIARGVTVAGMACDPYPHLYENTEKIVCKVSQLFETSQDTQMSDTCRWLSFSKPELFFDIVLF